MKESRFSRKEAPTSVALASGNTYFRQYKQGILNNLACPVGTDHDALAVGYGEVN